jgi:hypothetical protein
MHIQILCAENFDVSQAPSRQNHATLTSEGKKANLVKNPCPKSTTQARPALNNWKGIFGQLEGGIWFGTVLVR